MESPSPVVISQVQDQSPDSPNQNSSPGRRRNRNRPPRTPAPPANASSSDSLVTTLPTDGTGVKLPQTNNKSRDRKQGTPNTRRPHAVPQTAASSSQVTDGTDSADVQPPPTMHSRPPRHRQGASAGNKPQVTDSAPAQPQTKSQRPSRRSKFNTSLSEPSPLAGDSKTIHQAHTPAQASSKPKRVKPPRSKAPLADDLTSTLIHALSTPPYPDCPICFNAIRPEQPTWSCSSSEPSENLQCCWSTFHLKCIRAWAAKSVKDLEEAWRIRGEERAGEWRCPGCQAKRERVPLTYWQVLLSTYVTLSISSAPCDPPQLAAGVDEKSRLSVVLLWHLQIRLLVSPATSLAESPCHVGIRSICALRFAIPVTASPALRSKSSLVIVAKRKEKSHVATGKTRLFHVLLRERSTGKVGMDVAVYALCAHSDVTPQPISVIVILTLPLRRPFACGIHTCEKGCHPPSFKPPRCPLDPFSMQTCACGRFALPTVVQHDRYISGGQSITTPKCDTDGRDIAYFLRPRTSCTVPVPTCQQRCIKTLPDCSHQCGINCHIGPCPPCTELVERSCRCGATSKKIKCGETRSADGETKEVLCDRACPALRACGRHQCNRVCCPLASLAQRGKGKKRAGPTPDELGAEEGGLHECDLPCGKMLSCGNHRCERKDHRGVCGVCLQSVYEEVSDVCWSLTGCVLTFEQLICPCGRTIMEPPIQCGTIMKCTYPCARSPPLCGHARIPHSCHEGVIIAGADLSQTEEESTCPPCPFLTSKQCACGKNMVDNIRCAQERVSCGSACGKLLACGFHHCERLCHADDCGTCTAVCGKSRKSCFPAHHPCTQTCHAPAACPETEACLTLVTLTCPCGLLRSSVPCSQTSSTAKLKCTGECAIKLRNARLADALGISPEKRDGMIKVTYNEDLTTFARTNGKFLALVEKTFSDFVSSDKRTQVLPHMPPERRKFVHGLASIYRLDTQMVDQEPHRSVQLIRRIDTRIPTPLLSTSLASQASPPVLGKLADLRAPRAVASLTGAAGGWGQPKGTESGGRWTAVVTRPVSGSSSPAPGTSSSSGGVAAATLKPSSGAWVSPSVQRAREVASQESSQSQEAVPDDWEDDA
ncbi:hypothetical protein AZE42_09960 [Rhizopogon vesiculosus]|uniref:R3H domain-containing protein n=1 Tax=Rhizopogon vesiculosus TaxID=180088 RepID=A0A1J8QQG0_9AGAM|nr:hypothetical protein AZE42_09960 [Rhizopogon vesiculosus]